VLNFKEVKYVKKIPKGGFILSGDLGGTNSTFAVLNNKFKLILYLRFKSQEITNFTETVKQVLNHLKSKHKIKISSSCFAAACPIRAGGQYCSLTNTNWEVDAKKIKKETGLKSIALINDFEAIAYGIDVIPRKHLAMLKQGKRETKGTRAIIGAGTGLGKGIMIWNDKAKRYLTLKSEGGHANLPILDKEEFKLLEFLKKKNKDVRWEDVLSGNGLRNLYLFFKTQLPKTKYSPKLAKSGYDPMVITELRNKDKICREVFKHFVKFYGRCAKNFALDTLSLGGVYIAGGIAANCHTQLRNKNFLKEFLNSKKQKFILEKIPVTVIKNYNISLYGAAVAAFLKNRGLI
jgi:glucokinase